MDERLKITVVSGNSLASSRRTYCEVQLVSSEGSPIGKAIRTRYCNKTQNPEWEQELIFPNMGFGGFVLSVWEHHTLFPDKFLGVVTIQFNEQKLREGGDLLDDSFTLSKRKPRDVVSGKIRLSVKYGTGVKLPKVQVKALPADQKDPGAAEDGQRQHRPLRVSSKWGLSKSIENHQRAFVVVEEDSDEEDVKPDASPSASPSKPGEGTSDAGGKKPKKSPRKPTTKDGDGEDIDWNGSSGKKTVVTRPKKGGAKSSGGSKKPANTDGSDSDSDGDSSSSTSDGIDWNGSGGSKKPIAKRGGGGRKPATDDGDDIDWNGKKDTGKKVGSNGSGSGTSTPKLTGARGSRSVKTMKIREQVAEVIRLCNMEGSLIKDCKKDDSENLTFSLLNAAKGTLSPVTLIIPESVRTGEFLLFTEDGAVELGAPGTIFRAMAKVMANYAEQHELTEYLPIFPKDCETPNSDTESPEPSRAKKAGRRALLDSFQDVDFSNFTGGSSLGDTSGNIVRFTEEFQNLHGKPSFGMFKKPNGQVLLRFSFKPDTILSDLMAEIWLIEITKSIVVELLISTASSSAPSVALYQTSATDLNVDTPESSTFGLMWYLQKRLERYIGKNWPPTAQNHLFLDMITYAIDKISVCTKTCVICDTPLAFEMLKPSICDSALCTFSSEQYGLGQDVVAMLQHNPEVFDLLISSTAAIAQRSIDNTTDGKRFSPFPTGVEVNDAAGKLLTFMKGSNNNFDLIKDALNALPSVKEMATYTSTQSLKKFLDGKHPMAFPLLRWILTSNRTHLAKLKPDEQISQVPTPHQYLMLSATPARERVFQQRKKEYGSFWAFHGSGFFNWHAILRTGLRNLSGTDLMSTGAVYGNGIYLAAESGTSIGYAQSFRGWNLSSHGNPGDEFRCMALCEVVNAGYTANPYYVIPKEEDIVTRYLFIFPPSEASQMQNASIYAKQVTVPKTSFDQLHVAKKP